MTPKQAVQIVIGLAEENILEECQCSDEGMDRDREDQIEAVRVVRQYFKTLGIDC